MENYMQYFRLVLVRKTKQNWNFACSLERKKTLSRALDMAMLKSVGCSNGNKTSPLILFNLLGMLVN